MGNAVGTKAEIKHIDPSIEVKPYYRELGCYIGKPRLTNGIPNRRSIQDCFNIAKNAGSKRFALTRFNNGIAECWHGNNDDWYHAVGGPDIMDVDDSPCIRYNDYGYGSDDDERKWSSLYEISNKADDKLIECCKGKGNKDKCFNYWNNNDKCKSVFEQYYSNNSNDQKYTNNLKLPENINHLILIGGVIIAVIIIIALIFIIIKK
jgi:hypothetical protein